VAEIQLTRASPTRLPQTGDGDAEGFGVLAIALMTVGFLTRRMTRKPQ
jgi:LPXTG-motif cell wall-anchored protein